MVTKRQLENLRRGREIRRKNLQSGKTGKTMVISPIAPLKHLRRRIVYIPRNASILNPQFFDGIPLSDIDPSRVDGWKRENCGEAEVNRDKSFFSRGGDSVARGETLFADLDDVMPRQFQRRRR